MGTKELTKSGNGRKAAITPQTTTDSSPKHSIYVGIISAPGNAQRRANVREQWLSAARARFPQINAEPSRVALEFIVGRCPIHNGQFTWKEQGAKATADEVELEKSVSEESERYGDIRRVAAVDAYSELPGKVLMMMTHALEGGFNFIVKVDDDQYLDIDAVLAGVEEDDLLDLLYAGVSLFDRASYPQQTGVDGVFKPYFAGVSYILSSSLADGIARRHFGHTVAYSSYGNTAEDVDMGRWVAFEEELSAAESSRLVHYRTLPISTDLSTTPPSAGAQTAKVYATKAATTRFGSKDLFCQKNEIFRFLTRNLWFLRIPVTLEVLRASAADG